MTNLSEGQEVFMMYEKPWDLIVLLHFFVLFCCGLEFIILPANKYLNHAKLHVIHITLVSVLLLSKRGRQLNFI